MAIVPKDEEYKWIEFDGDSECSNDCRGWNGIDNRCDCGNARVNFECLEGSCKCSDGKMIDCPNAYAVTN